MPLLRPALAVAALASAVLAAPAAAQLTLPEDAVVSARALPGNDAARGLIYDGLQTVPSGPCWRMYRLITTGGCTSGPDAEFPGLDIATDVPPLPEREPKVQCHASPTRGVQVVYARASDAPDRYDDYVDSIRQWAGQADRFVRNTAATHGGERHVPFVQDADCRIDVANVTMAPGADDTFDATVADLAAQRFRNRGRKYLVFVDANVYCGIAEMEDDDSDARANLNNTGPHIARIDAGCWNGDVAAHELMHTLGAVQLSAPHSDGNWHCTGACVDTDHFHVSPPPGSYLDTHWNVARSDFLVRARQDLWGYVSAERPTTASYTPWERRQRNSTNASNSVVRTATGAYTVTFPNLGVTGGTVNVTAIGSSYRNCKVNDWGHRYADLEVRVRCFDGGGIPTDALFSATFARPAGWLAGRRFAYVWADRPTTALYSPDVRYQYNSDGGVNNVTRTGSGRYQVQLPAIGGPGGSANVTAWGPGSATCKLVNFAGRATDELVDVACHTAAGVPTDSKFTLTFHGDDGILGVPTDATSPRAHVLADQPTSASYTPVLSEQFNSGGGPLEIFRSWPAWYSVRIPGFEDLGGNVQVTALSFSGDSVRCQINNWSTSWSSTTGPATNVSVRCFDAAGAGVDAPFTMSYVR
jgi:hypothetical protein